MPDRFTGPRLEFSVLTRNLSDDGNRVFFDSPDRLLASDTNDVNDVYEWEAKGTGSCTSEDDNGGCLYLLSTGTDPEPSYFADASASGDDAFFFTSQSLVRQDQDDLIDVYDARVGGGIAAQNPTPVAPCEGEACRPQAQAPPSFATPGSASFAGPPNPKPKQTKLCKKKKQGKKKRCKSKRQGKKKDKNRSGRASR
jgi:hypothetical protein